MSGGAPRVGRATPEPWGAAAGPAAQPLGATLLRATLHRIDAWGVAFVVAGTALVVHREVRIETLGLAFAIALMYWVAYTVNDFFDAPYDAQDPRKASTNVFVARPESARAIAWMLAGASLAVLAIFARFGGPALWMLAIFVAFSSAYSAPPARLKDRPGLDLLIHGVFVLTWAYPSCLVALGVRWTTTDALIVALCFLASVGGQLRQQLRDFEVDARTARTFAVTVGARPALILHRIVQMLVVAVFGAGLAGGHVPVRLLPLGLAVAPSLVESLIPARVRARSMAITYVAFGSALAYLCVLFALAARAEGEPR